MTLSLGARSKARREISGCGIGAEIRRRHVIYVAGYEPRSAKGYYRLFERECDRFQGVWPVKLKLEPGDLEAGDFARWRVDALASNWQVSTTYDLLRLDKFIRSDLAAPLPMHILRSFGWIVGDLASGAELRIFRASWRFGLHLLFVQMALLVWMAFAAAIGAVAAYAVTEGLGFPEPIGILAGVLAALAAIPALAPVARRWGAIQIPSCWVVLRRFARGRTTWLDEAIELGARRLTAAAQGEADEIVVVGHSAGCVIAAAMMARALQADPDLGRRGPRLVLLTLGSVMPAAALHPAARIMRDIIRRLAVEPALAWIDCQSRKDVMAFLNFDPVDGVGVHVGGRRRNPLMWRVPFKDMLSPEDYRRLRWQFFRVHFQYIMAGDRPCAYDYILLVTGPVAMAEWAQKHRQLTLSFITDRTSDGAGGAGDEGRRSVMAGAGP